MATDEQLIKQIKEGNSEEFGQLFCKYYGKIYSICLSMLKNPDDAEEIASDTFVSAYLKLNQLSKPDKFFPWLKRIARNRSKDFLRSKRRETIALSHSVPTMQKTTHDFVLAQENPDILVLKQELIDAIMEAIESLPAKDREVIQARIDGLNHSQISEKLSISISASMNRLYRAKKKIAAHVKNLLNCIIGLPKTLPLEKIVSGGIEAMKVGTSKEVTTGVIAATQSLMFSVIFHIALFIGLSLFLPYKFHSDRQKVDVYMEVALIPAEEHQPMQRLPGREAKPAIPVKSSFSPVKKASPKSSPRGFLSAKKPESQEGIEDAVMRMGNMRKLQIGAGVSVKGREKMLSGGGKGEEIIPAASVERGLEVGKGDVGLADRVSEIAKGRSGVDLEMRKVERLKPVSPQRGKFSKQAGLSMLNDVGAADADDTLANVAKDMMLDQTGFGVPKLPKGEPGGIVIGRGKDIRGYLRFPRVDCSMVDRNLVERFYSLSILDLIRWINANTNIKVDMNVEGGGIQLADARLFDSPVIFLLGYDHLAAWGIEASTGKGRMVGWGPSPGVPHAKTSSHLTDIERKRLREYLVEKGGTLVVDTQARINMLSKEEYPWSRKMRRELREILPEYPMKRIENDHELYHSYYVLGGPPPGISTFLGFAFAREPYLEGISINGRLAVIYCREGYSWMMSPYFPLQSSVFRLMTNIIVYALTHSGISDKSGYVPQKEIQESAEEIPKKPPAIPSPTPNLRR